MNVFIRQATVSDAYVASAVVRRSFTALASGSWTEAAVSVFLNQSSPEELQKKIPRAAYAAVARFEDETVGFILLPVPNYVSMLFVHPAALRRGIGKALWETTRRHIEMAYPQAKTVEVNSTLCALPFYRALGFVPISKAFEREGGRAIRMACWLPARGLGAELHAPAC
jgi:ribosomal protein S18 acetylase RimI-like enzyme